ELRLIKTATEIDLIRRGVKLTEHGIMACLEGLDEQTTAPDLRARYHEACFAAARQQREHGFQSARTMTHLGPALCAWAHPARPAHRGDLVQFDSGVQISG